MGPPKAKRPRLIGQFPCEKCDRVFEKSRYLTKHVSRMHAGPAKAKEVVGNLTCKVCGKQFPRLSHLTRHQITHLDVREWGCPLCSLNFQQKAHLVTHLARKHRNAPLENLNDAIEQARNRGEDVQLGPSLPSTSAPLVMEQIRYSLVVCVACGAQFTSTFQLKRHRRVNHALQSCRVCGERVTGTKELRIHFDTHRPSELQKKSGTKVEKLEDEDEAPSAVAPPFLCLHCQTSFKQRTQLDRHFVSRHFVKDPCRECGAPLGTPVEVKRHAEESHGVALCGYCGQFFSDPVDVVGHVGKVHWRRERAGLPTSSGKAVKRSAITSGSEEEEEVEEEDQEVSIYVQLSLTGESPPSEGIPLAPSLPPSLLRTLPELETLRVIIPRGLIGSTSIVVHIPLPSTAETRLVDGKTFHCPALEEEEGKVVEEVVEEAVEQADALVLHDDDVPVDHEETC